MSVPAKHYLDELRQLKGAPKVSHPHGGTTYPRIERVYSVPKGRVSAIPTTLADFAGSVLVLVSELARDQVNVEVYCRYDTFPGPWIETKTQLRKGAAALDTVYLRRRVRDVAASASYPFQAGANLSHAFLGQTVMVSTEAIEEHINGAGAAVSAPIHSRVTWVTELGVQRIYWRQLQDWPGAAPAIGATYSTGGVIAGGAATLTLLTAGENYGQVALVEIARGTGARALAHATMKLADAQITAAGDLWAIGETITIAGSTGTASVLTVTGAGVATLAINAAGIDYAPGNTVTLAAGGAAITRGVVTVATTRLVGYSSIVPGSGYFIGVPVALTGGTYSVQAQFTPATVTLVSVGSITNGGSGYNNGDTITLYVAGGVGVISNSVLTVTSNSGGVITGVSVSAGGETSAQDTTATQDSTSGGGTGAEFGGLLWGVVTGTISTAGSYTVNGTNLTHASGLQLSGARYGILTFTVTTPGNYSATSTTFTQHATSGSGSGATFQSATFGLAAVSISTAGVLTALPPAAITVATVEEAGVGYQALDTITFAGGTGTAAVVMVEQVAGSLSTGKVSAVSVYSGGSYNTLPEKEDPDGLITRANFTQASVTTRVAVGGTVSVNTGTNVVTSVAHGRSVGHRVAIDSTLTNPGGISKARAYFVKTVPSADTLTLSATDGGATLDITSAGTGTITLYAPDTANPGSGAGAEFTADYRVTVSPDAAASSGSGISASFELYYAVNSLVLDQAGDGYLSDPAVTITGTASENATASADASAITVGSSTGYVVESGSEPTDGPQVEAFWVTMPVPGTRTLETNLPWVRPGTFRAKSNIVHQPPWPGIDTEATPARSADFPALVQENFQFGPFTRAQMFTTFSFTTPGASSRRLDIPDRSIHNAINLIDDDGGYAESFPASTVTGIYGGLACDSCKQEEIATNIYRMRSIFFPAPPIPADE